MCQFIESICCVEGEVQNIHWHQARVNRTFKKYFEAPPFQIETTISRLSLPATKSKCRIVYDSEIKSISLDPYHIKNIKSLKLIDTDTIDYSFKFSDRKSLDLLYKEKGEADDIIIVKNDIVTDSYYANLAFFDGHDWYTPLDPLLKGTKREKYLHDGILEEKKISTQDIHDYQKVSLINAMLDLSEIELVISENSIY